MTSTALATQTQPIAHPQIAIAPPAFAQPRSLAEVETAARMMLESGFFKDVKSLAQACVKISAGAALGYDVVTSMNAFHIIEGKIAPTAGEVGARIKRSGKYNYRVAKMDDSEVTLMFLERDGDAWMELGPSTFAMSDAITAGVAGKDVWKKYKRNMLFSRALTNGARWYCPDVFGGPVYTAEELGANVDVVDGEIVVIDANTPSSTASKDDRKPPTGAEVKALYADARKLHPDWPEDARTWLLANVNGFPQTGNPTAKMMVEARAKLETILADGAPVAVPEAQDGPEEAIEAEHRPVNETPAQEPVKPVSEPESHTRPVESHDSAFPPEHNGEPMTRTTQARLFAILKDLGVGVPLDSTKAALSVARDERIGYAQSFGLAIQKSYSELSDEQARWLADKAQAELECVACRGRNGSHAVDCSEAV